MSVIGSGKHPDYITTACQDQVNQLAAPIGGGADMGMVVRGN
jgi:hypothetical protein